MTDMSRFEDYLKNPGPRTEATEARLAAFRAALKVFGADRVTDLNDRQKDALAEGLRIGPQPGRASRAISLIRAGELARETGESRDACVRFLEAQADGHGYQEAARVYAQRTGEAALACASMMNRIMVKDRELSEAAAQKDGKLWTIRGAVGAGRVDFLIANGRSSKMLEAMISIEFPSAYGVVEITTMGTRLDAMARASELVNLQEYGFRFL